MFKQNLHTRVSTLPGLSQKYFCALGIYRMTAWSNISGLLLHSKASLGVSALTHINKKNVSAVQEKRVPQERKWQGCVRAQ